MDYILLDNSIIVATADSVFVEPKTQQLINAVRKQDYKKVQGIVMGIRSDLAIAYSKVGWEKMEKYFASLSLNDQEMILDLIQDADQHLIHFDGDHLLSWTSMKSGCADMDLLNHGHSSALDDEDYYSVEIYDCGGDEEISGGYYDNPFGICCNRSIFINDTDSEEFSMENLLIMQPQSSKIDSSVSGPTVIVDDHVCPACGNTKCSRQEKSCWKCGSSL
jgi:hypothetical protein